MTTTHHTEASMLYVTASSDEEAEKIANNLVAARLVACANVLPGMHSVYWWDGQVQKDEECVLILKTRTALVGRVIERVRELHSYTCPCVVALPIEMGNPAYIEWINTETAAAM